MLTKDRSEKELLQEARQAEVEDQIDKAIGLYKFLIRKNHLEPLYYDRLMILYRKQRNYPTELDLLKKGIHAFENYFASRTKKLFSHDKNKIVKLSEALMKKTGLKEKGHEYLPEPLSKWHKRKSLLEKKINQQIKKRAV